MENGFVLQECIGYGVPTQVGLPPLRSIMAAEDGKWRYRMLFRFHMPAHKTH